MQAVRRLAAILAAELQRAMLDREAGMPEDRRIQVPDRDQSR
jgi:hypothetical protein